MKFQAKPELNRDKGIIKQKTATMVDTNRNGGFNNMQEQGNGLEIYSKLYKNAKMGTDSIIKLLDKAEDSKMKMRMTKQLNGYEGFAAKSKAELEDMGFPAKEESPMTKMWASMGMKMNTMMDSSDSHIAQLMIEGSTMGITDTTKLIHEYENTQGCEAALKLAGEMVQFEQSNIEKMKEFL